jgi:diacylglycerol kinase (ATP)
MKHQNFSVKNRIRSLKYAFNGLSILIKEEHNARIHLVVTICVLIAGFVLKISVNEWIAIIFAIGFVFALEIINSALENIADFVSPGKNERIKKIKDLSAAGVLVSALTAFIIGLIIFLPKIIDHIGW